MLEQTLEPASLDGQIIDSARTGDVESLRGLLDEHPDKLHLKVPPYEMSLLFPAAQSGSIDAVDLTPLHLAAAYGHAEVVRVLPDAGANPRIRDTKHDGDAFGWAEHFKKPEIVQLLKDRTAI